MFSRLSYVFGIGPKDEPSDAEPTTVLAALKIEGEFICDTAIALLKAAIKNLFSKKLVVKSKVGKINKSSFHLVIYPQEARSKVIYTVSFWSPLTQTDEFMDLEDTKDLASMLELPISTASVKSVWSQFSCYEVEVLNTRQFSKISSFLDEPDYSKSLVHELHERYGGYHIQYRHIKEGYLKSLEPRDLGTGSDFWSSSLTSDANSMHVSRINADPEETKPSLPKEKAPELAPMVKPQKMSMPVVAGKIAITDVDEDDWKPQKPAKKASLPVPTKNPMEESSVWNTIPRPQDY